MAVGGLIESSPDDTPFRLSTCGLFVTEEQAWGAATPTIAALRRALDGGGDDGQYQR